MTRLLAIALLVAACATPSSAVHVGAARFSAAPFEGRGATTEHDRLSGAPQPEGQGFVPAGSVTVDVSSRGAPQPYDLPMPNAHSPVIDTRTGTPADFTSQGSIAWAAPRYGPLYLALPEPRGTVAIVCGPAGCVTRTSNDFGPDQRTYPDRIADVSAADFPVICGVPLSFGHCPGSVTILSRPHLPETDQ